MVNYKTQSHRQKQTQRSGFYRPPSCFVLQAAFELLLLRGTWTFCCSDTKRYLISFASGLLHLPFTFGFAPSRSDAQTYLLNGSAKYNFSSPSSISSVEVSNLRKKWRTERMVWAEMGDKTCDEWVTKRDEWVTKRDEWVKKNVMMDEKRSRLQTPPCCCPSY